MTRRLIAIVALLVVLAFLARRPAAPEKPILRRSARPAEAPPTPAVQPEPPASKKDPLWTCVKAPDPLRRTAEVLEIRAVEEFVGAAQDTVARLQRARARRQSELSVPEPGIQVSVDSDAAYEAERVSALARLEPFLDQRESHREFRDRLDTWAASVWASSQGVYRR